MSDFKQPFDAIYRSICSAGETFTGGNAAEIAEAWAESFTADEVDRWIESECWCEVTAGRLRAAGFRPGVDTLSYRPGKARDDMDPMYALCNSDVSINDVTW